MSATIDAPAHPRRSTRTVAKQPTVASMGETSSAKAIGKRKAPDPEKQAASQLDYLLTNPKSKLTTMDFSNVLNYESFISMSPEHQEVLCSFLPPTAFFTFRPTVDPTHPSHSSYSISDAMDVDRPSSSEGERSPATLDPTFFTSSFFLSAARTFQDHVYSGWLSAKEMEAVEKYHQGVSDGSLHAEWKDEAWERNNRPAKRTAKASTTHLDLSNLARRSLLKEGDLLVYRRHFPHLSLTVEKDLLVQSIQTQSHSSLTLLLQPGTARSLPSSLLVVAPPSPEPPTLSMEDIMSAAELEDGVLDVDGRVSRTDRVDIPVEQPGEIITANIAFWGDGSSANIVSSNRAAKALAVWRWREEVFSEPELYMTRDRGGRELLGTVYYLDNA